MASGRGALEVGVALSELIVCLSSNGFDAVPSVQSGSDLFICFDKTFKFNVQFSVLSGEDVAVLFQSIDLGLNILVSFVQGSVCESQVVLLASGGAKLFICVSAFALEVVQVRLESFVSLEFAIRSSCQVCLFTHLKVQRARKLSLFVLETRLFVASSQQISVGTVISLSSTSQIKVSKISNFGEFACSFLGFVKVVVERLDAIIVISVLSFFCRVQVLHAVDLILVACSFFLQFAEFESEVVDVLSESVAAIRLGLDISL